MKNHTTTEVIAREGWKYIGVFTLLTVLLFIAELNFLAFISLLLTGFNLFLFRNPEREPVSFGKGILTAPIDGIISQIESEESFNKIKIKHHFLQDSHILRAPIDMKIEDFKTKKGLFLDADNKKASKLNEKLEIFTHTDFGKLVMKMMPSQCSRGIDFFDRDEIIAGSRFGILMDGYIELYLPKILEIQVEVGEKLIARNSVIAKAIIKGE